MKVLIAYASTEGQTRKICRFCADKLVDAGHSVELVEVAGGEAGLHVERFDAAILAASVHIGKFQKEFVGFAGAHAEALNAIPTLFLSVSLAAASGDRDELAELDMMVSDFAARSGWTPGRVEQIAGAFRFTEYDFFKSWAMRWIAAQTGQQVDPKSDREYTDWTALEAIIADWSG